MLKYILTSLLFLSCTLNAQDVFHERIISFEEKNLTAWKAIAPEGSKRGPISRDNFLYKHGKHSLRWEWYAGNSLLLDTPIGFQPADPTGKDTYLSTFVVWVYNETALDDHISFQFGRDGQVDCRFDFRIDFKGWRAAWVTFERDMEGSPHPEMNQLRIQAPSKAPQGRLYFDHLILSTLSDSRYQTPDFQVPQVNAATDSHWLLLLKYAGYIPDIQEEKLLDEACRQDIKTIEQRLVGHLCPTERLISQRTLTSFQQQIDAYHIRIKEGRVSGKPLWFVRASEVYERFFDDWYQWYAQSNQSLDAYFKLMEDIARAYQQTDEAAYKTVLADQFLLLYRHAEEQGIAAGSGLGTIHHSGYSFRSYYPALYLMKEVLAAAGKQQQAMRAMQWYAATGEVLKTPAEPGMDMDAFNTTATGRLASILMMEDCPEKLVYLKSFVRWIDNGMQPSNGLNGAFKLDGAVMHHCNHYPAYGIGGISGASLMTYLFSGTGLRISENGHANLKRAMLAMRFYCQTKEWPVSISGRHPRGTEALVPSSYALMALSGTPDGKQTVDEEMAAAYLRLTQYDQHTTKYARQFSRLGISPEKEPWGNRSINYGCLNIHRRDHWMAAARGFSRYLWAAEHYIGANYYGRYLSHGSLFIQTGRPGELVSNASSAYRQLGWDWNSIPGTTAIHLPLSLLKANILNVDTFSGYEEMLLSDEAFAGGLSQSTGNGLFAMKLHEHDKYNGSLRARKSMFFFDDMIVCLGSDIENDREEYSTRTTLYQNAMDSEKELNWKDGRFISGLGSDSFRSKGNVLIDRVRTGYYLAPGQEVSWSRKWQDSKDQAADTLTRGLFALAWIEHGKAPSGAGYEYAVFPESTPEKMKAVAKSMRKNATARYQVERKDKNQHMVTDKHSQTTGLVVFEPEQAIAHSLLKAVDKPCLLMLKEQGSDYLLTVSDPDLHLYEGPSDDLYDEQGKRIERSIYSRPWIGNPSAVSFVSVRLKGKWTVSDKTYCTIIYHDQKETTITFRCQDGLSREVVLSPL